MNERICTLALTLLTLFSIALAEAVRAYTEGAAYAAGLESRLGQLAPGFLADLVVLDRDIFALPPEALLETRARRVMVGGAWE